MTTTSLVRPVPLPHGRYRTSGVLRSEWTKLRSVRSTTWSLLAMVVISIGIGILATSTEAARWSQATLTDRLTFDPVSLSLTGLLFAQLAIGVLGVLVISAEYGTGSIRATFSAVPNRPLVLAAKALVFGVVALVVSEVVSFAAFFIGQAILTGSAPHATLSQPGVLRAVIGSGLYLTILGLFALGIGAILRHTAGAISVFVAILLVAPLILQALPEFIRDRVAKFLPANIGVTIISTSPNPEQAQAHPFPAWVGLGVLAAYALAALLIGGWLMLRRDA
ncbi:MAG TPA: hypothetical protein VKG43_04015 [Acidimicrobiales bacterium]|nr:hypothetical protein [Acidimicrobiales bacterium]